MGMHLPPHGTIGGILASHAQKIIKKCGRWQTDRNGKYSLFVGDEYKNALKEEELPVMKSLANKGFAKEIFHKDGPYYHMTPPGEELFHASFKPRVSLERADVYMDQLKAGITRLDKEGIRKVQEVWIFGSYMRREPSVGDIDACMTIGDVKDKPRAHIDHLCKDETWYQNDRKKHRNFYIERYDANRILGAKRHTFFKDVDTTLYILESKRMPCQRIYTAEHGWKHEEIRDHHPECTERTGIPRPEISIMLDQGTFSNTNRGELPPNKKDTLQGLAVAQQNRFDHTTPKQEKPPTKRVSPHNIQR